MQPTNESSIYENVEVQTRVILVSRLKNLVRLTVFLLLAFSLYFHNSKTYMTRRYPNYSEFSNYGCKPTLVDPWNKDVLQFYSIPVSVNCSTESKLNNTFLGAAFQIRDGRYLHKLVELGMPCCFRSFSRVDDEKISYSNKCITILDNVTVIPSNIDFIEVLCRQQFQIKYRDAFPIVQHRTSKNITGQNENSKPQLNVLMIGLDAVSHANFIRQMPQSNNYLLHKLGAISLNGHSIVGASTCPNIIPILTGYSQAELIEKCGKRNWDNCPFIWNKYSKQGYLTNFAEDYPNFNDKWPWAFKEPPTDYYLRPYILHMRQYVPTKTPSYCCLGPRLAFEMVLDYAMSVAKASEEKNQSYFQLTWTSLLAHDNMNNLGVGDETLLKTLRKLTSMKSFNDTVLFVLADHGQGGYNDQYFFTESGDIEYRMPLVYIVLPPWFNQTFPREYNNLIENSNKMTSHFDIHKTLLDLLNLGKTKMETSQHGNGISLFDVIPEKRNCLEAGIDLRWCIPCHSKIPVDSTKLLVETAAEKMVEWLNNRRLKNADKCEIQNLSSVEASSMWDPRDVVRAICSTSWHDSPDHPTTKFGVFCDMASLITIVDLRIKTGPHGAVYLGEVMVIRNGYLLGSFKDDKMIVIDSLYRVDKYADSGHCVSKWEKPFCICKASEILNR